MYTVVSGDVFCSVIILCVFCAQLSAKFLKIAFFLPKKGANIGFPNILCFKFWKNLFFRFAFSC